ncbi:MAG TPA: hypothetical protein VME66_07835, partial [Candidatus Acidoferrales bacterium]|nr:hypothetical protein [Candidatus Acidoferrales bacterium]
MTLAIGDVVRVPLGTREVYGYVVREPYEDAVPRAGLRAVAARAQGVPAFDAVGLHLARWIAAYYCCSLGEALSAVVYAAAIPRTVERFVVAERPEPGHLPSVPPRLLRLIWEDLREGFTLEALLRHAEARRAGDRATLLRALSALVRAGHLQRERTAQGPRMEAATERLLEVTGKSVRGPRLAQLVARVQEEGQLRRRDAALEGYSSALIARALREGALRERIEPVRTRTTRAVGETVPFTATAEQRQAIEAIVARTTAGVFS